MEKSTVSKIENNANIITEDVTFLIPKDLSIMNLFLQNEQSAKNSTIKFWKFYGSTAICLPT